MKLAWILALLIVTAFVVGCQKQAAPAQPTPSPTETGTPSPAPAETGADLQTADDDFTALDEAVSSLS